MNDKFFPELARRLKREGISTGPVEKGCLPVLADGRAAVLVMSRGTVAFNADVERGPEADSVYDLTFALSREVYEYTEAMASAPPLVAEGLHEGFRVLADFNGVVLAGQELEADWGYKFATWRRSPDRTAVGSFTGPPSWTSPAGRGWWMGTASLRMSSLWSCTAAPVKRWKADTL